MSVLPRATTFALTLAATFGLLSGASQSFFSPSTCQAESAPDAPNAAVAPLQRLKDVGDDASFDERMTAAREFYKVVPKPNPFVDEFVKFVGKTLFLPDATEEGIAEALDMTRRLGYPSAASDGTTLQFESSLEKLAQERSDSWRVRYAVALTANRGDVGTVQKGRFIPQNKLPNNSGFDGREYNRVLRWRRYAAIEPLVRAEVEKTLDAENAGADPEELKRVREECAAFYFKFIDELYGEGYRALARRTDLEVLPACSPKTNRPETPDLFSFDPDNRYGVPVDAAGEPIFFKTPNSFDEAQNDGERLMALLNDVERCCGKEGRLYALRYRASFAWAAFGVRALTYDDVAQRRDATLGEDRDDPWDRRSLDDSETVAYLTTGPRRVKLPPEYDFFAIWREILKEDPLDSDTLDRIALEYEARLLLSKAEEAKLKATEARRVKAQQRQNDPVALGNYRPDPFEAARYQTERSAYFVPSSSYVSGLNAALALKYRNASKVEITVRELNAQGFLDQFRVPGRVQEAGKTVEEQLWTALYNDKLSIEPASQDDGSNQNASGKQSQFGDGTRFRGDVVAQFDVELESSPEFLFREKKIELPVHKPGLYLVEATNENSRPQETIVWLSSNTLIRRADKDGFQILVVDSATGKPKSGVKVESFEDDRLLAKTTGKNGLVRFLTTEKKSNASFTIATSQEGDVVDCSCLDRNFFWGRDDFPFLARKDKQLPSTVQCFMSQQSYRPGQTVKFFGWFKTLDPTSPFDPNFATGVNGFEYALFSPTNARLIHRKTEPDSVGAFTGSFELPKDLPDGNYELHVGRSGFLNGSPHTSILTKTIAIRSYDPDRYRVTIAAPKTPVAPGEAFETTVAARDVDGSPLKGARVFYRLVRKRRAPFGRYVDSTWDDLYGQGYAQLAYTEPTENDLATRRGYQLAGSITQELVEATATLDDQGTLKLRFDTSEAARVEPNEDSLYTLFVQVDDPTRGKVVAAKSIDVVRRPFRTAIQFERGFYCESESINATLQARRPDGKPVVGTANVKLFRETYADANAEPTETEVGAKTLELDAQGRASVAFDAQPSGQYRLACVVETSDGRREEDAQTILVCDKNGAIAPNAARFNALEIVPDKSEYKVGEFARFLFASSRPNAFAHVWLRSENAIATSVPQTLQLKNGIAILKTRVGENDRPNFFVQAVALVDGRVCQEQREAFVPPRDRLIEVAVAPRQTVVRPCEKTSVDVLLTDRDGEPTSGRVVLAAYDAALGGAAKSTTLELYRAFWNDGRFAASTTNVFASFAFPRNVPNLDNRYFPLNVKERIAWDKRMLPTQIGGRGLVATFPSTFQRLETMKPRDPVLNLGTSGVSQIGASKLTPQELYDFPDSSYAWIEKEAPRQNCLDDSRFYELFNASTRSDDADLAYWSVVSVDQSGKLHVEFDAPKNLSTWKIVALGVDELGRFGLGEAFFKTEAREEAVVETTPRKKTSEETLFADAGAFPALDVVDVRAKTFTFDVPKAQEGASTRLTLRVAPTVARALFDVALDPKLRDCSRSNDLVQTLADASILYDVRQATLRPISNGLSDYQRKRSKFYERLEEIRNDRTRPEPPDTFKAALAARREAGVSSVYDAIFDQGLVMGAREVGLDALRRAQRPDAGWNWSSDDDAFPSNVEATAFAARYLYPRFEIWERANLPWTELAKSTLREVEDEEAVALCLGRLSRTSGVEPAPIAKLAVDDSDVALFVASCDFGAVNNELYDGFFAKLEEDPIKTARHTDGHRILRELLWEGRDELSFVALERYALALTSGFKLEEKTVMRVKELLERIAQYRQVDEAAQTVKIDASSLGLPHDQIPVASALYLQLLTRCGSGTLKELGLDADPPRVANYLLASRDDGLRWKSVRTTIECAEALAVYVDSYLYKEKEDDSKTTVEVFVDGKLRKTFEFVCEPIYLHDGAFELTDADLPEGVREVVVRATGPGALYYAARLTQTK